MHDRARNQQTETKRNSWTERRKQQETLTIPLHTYSYIFRHVAPWATGLIEHRRPYLLIHGLFALADPCVEPIGLVFITTCMDLIHRTQDWKILLSSIRDENIPDIEHIDHVRTYLQISNNLFSKKQRSLRIAELHASWRASRYRAPPLLSWMGPTCLANPKYVGVHLQRHAFAIVIPKARNSSWTTRLFTHELCLSPILPSTSVDLELLRAFLEMLWTLVKRVCPQHWGHCWIPWRVRWTDMRQQSSGSISFL